MSKSRRIWFEGFRCMTQKNQKCMLLHEFDFPALYLRLGRSRPVIRFSGETWTIKLASQVDIASSTEKALKCKIYSPILLHFRDHKRDRCTWSDYEGRELKCISHIARPRRKKIISSLVNCKVLRLVAWASSFWRRKSFSDLNCFGQEEKKKRNFKGLLFQRSFHRSRNNRYVINTPVT